MRKAIQIIAMGWLLVTYPYAVAAEKCNLPEKPVCFGLNWQTATKQDVQNWLDSGGEVRTRTATWGQTPLLAAAQWNKNPAVILALIDAGADVNKKDYNETTPLHAAVFGNDNPAVIHTLIDAGANKNARNSFNITPLGLAYIHKKDKAIKALLTRGAKE